MRRFWEWFVGSVSDPHNLPHYLTAIFTLALAVFACYAWLESQRSTQALEGQLVALKAEQRPFLWTRNIGQPRFESPPIYGGQVLIDWQYMNYGRGIAYNIASVSYIRVGDGRYEPTFGLDIGPIPNKTGIQEPPAKVDFSTVTSRLGFSQDYFDKLMKTDLGFGIMIDFHYSGDSAGIERYSDVICLERFATSAWTFKDPDECKK
jgi:hypothetical protein